MVHGGRITHRRAGRLGGMASELFVGGETRYDNIGTVGLYHTVARVRQQTTREDMPSGKVRSACSRSTNCNGHHGCAATSVCVPIDIGSRSTPAIGGTRVETPQACSVRRRTGPRAMEVDRDPCETRWLTIDGDLAVSPAIPQPRLGGNRIAGAVERVVAAGVAIDDTGSVFGSLRLRYFGARDLIEDGRSRPQPAALVNGQGGVRISPTTRVVVDDIHLNPALRRSVRLVLQIAF